MAYKTHRDYEDDLDEDLEEALSRLEGYESGTLPEYQFGSMGGFGSSRGTRTWNPGTSMRATYPRSSGGNWFSQGGLRQPNLTSGGGGGGGGGSGAATTQSGTPYGAAGKTSGSLSKFGRGLLDPGSDLSKRYMEELREEVGRGTEAAERSAGYRAAQSGFGTGASPERLAMETAYGVAGQEAAGQAASDYMMRAPELGVRALTPALTADVSMRGQDLSSRIAENANRLSREQYNAGLEMQGRGQDLDYSRMMNDARLREMAILYGGLY